MSATKLPAFAEALGGDIVEYVIGQEAKIFRVHKDMIYDFAFFYAFEEADSGKIHLAQDEPFAFACFLEWVYKHDMEVLSEKMSIMQRIRVHCFAARYDFKELMNKLMDSIYESVKESPSLLNESAIDYVYSQCECKSGLKRFIVAAFVYALLKEDDGCAGNRKDERYMCSYNLVSLTRDHEELHDSVFQSLRDVKYHGSGAPWEVDVSRWHD